MSSSSQMSRCDSTDSVATQWAATCDHIALRGSRGANWADLCDKLVLGERVALKFMSRLLSSSDWMVKCDGKSATLRKAFRHEEAKNTRVFAPYHEILKAFAVHSGDEVPTVDSQMMQILEVLGEAGPDGCSQLELSKCLKNSKIHAIVDKLASMELIEKRQIVLNRSATSHGTHTSQLKLKRFCTSSKDSIHAKDTVDEKLHDQFLRLIREHVVNSGSEVLSCRDLCNTMDLSFREIYEVRKLTMAMNAKGCPCPIIFEQKKEKGKGKGKGKGNGNGKNIADKGASSTDVGLVVRINPAYKTLKWCKVEANLTSGRDEGGPTDVKLEDSERNEVEEGHGALNMMNLTLYEHFRSLLNVRNDGMQISEYRVLMGIHRKKASKIGYDLSGVLRIPYEKVQDGRQAAYKFLPRQKDMTQSLPQVPGRQAAASTSSSSSQPALAGLDVYSSDTISNVTGADNCPAKRAFNHAASSKTSKTGSDRQQWIESFVGAASMAISVMDILKHVREKEQGSNHTADRKSILRILTRMESSGKLKIISAAIPSMSLSVKRELKKENEDNITASMTRQVVIPEALLGDVTSAVRRFTEHLEIVAAASAEKRAQTSARPLKRSSPQPEDDSESAAPKRRRASMNSGGKYPQEKAVKSSRHVKVTDGRDTMPGGGEGNIDDDAAAWGRLLGQSSRSAERKGRRKTTKRARGTDADRVEGDRHDENEINPYENNNYNNSIENLSKSKHMRDDELIAWCLQALLSMQAMPSIPAKLLRKFEGDICRRESSFLERHPLHQCEESAGQGMETGMGTGIGADADGGRATAPPRSRRRSSPTPMTSPAFSLLQSDCRHASLGKMHRRMHFVGRNSIAKRVNRLLDSKTVEQLAAEVISTDGPAERGESSSLAMVLNDVLRVRDSCGDGCPSAHSSDELTAPLEEACLTRVLRILCDESLSRDERIALMKSMPPFLASRIYRDLMRFSWIVPDRNSRDYYAKKISTYKLLGAYLYNDITRHAYTPLLQPIYTDCAANPAKLHFQRRVLHDIQSKIDIDNHKEDESDQGSTVTDAHFNFVYAMEAPSLQSSLRVDGIHFEVSSTCSDDESTLATRVDGAHDGLCKTGLERIEATIALCTQPSAGEGNPGALFGSSFPGSLTSGTRNITHAHEVSDSTNRSWTVGEATGSCTRWLFETVGAAGPWGITETALERLWRERCAAGEDGDAMSEKESENWSSGCLREALAKLSSEKQILRIVTDHRYGSDGNLRSCNLVLSTQYRSLYTNTGSTLATEEAPCPWQNFHGGGNNRLYSTLERKVIAQLMSQPGSSLADLQSVLLVPTLRQTRRLMDGLVNQDLVEERVASRGVSLTSVWDSGAAGVEVAAAGQRLSTSTFFIKYRPQHAI